MHLRYLVCCWVLFLILFLTHIVGLCHFSESFLDFCSIHFFPRSSKMVLSSLQGGKTSCLLYWLDSCNCVWFCIGFPFAWDVNLNFFFYFIYVYLMTFSVMIVSWISVRNLFIEEARALGWLDFFHDCIFCDDSELDKCEEPFHRRSKSLRVAWLFSRLHFLWW